MPYEIRPAAAILGLEKSLVTGEESNGEAHTTTTRSGVPTSGFWTSRVAFIIVGAVSGTSIQKAKITAIKGM